MKGGQCARVQVTTRASEHMLQLRGTASHQMAVKHNANSLACSPRALHRQQPTATDQITVVPHVTCRAVSILGDYAFHMWEAQAPLLTIVLLKHFDHAVVAGVCGSRGEVH